MKLFNVICTNEAASVTAIRHFKTREEAEAALEEEKSNDIKVLSSNGWEEDNLDIQSNPKGYTIYFSEYFYHGEIVESELEF